MLLSVILPDYELSEPMVPPLPEDTELGKEEKDKQYDFIIRNSDLSTNAEYGLALTNETSYTPDLHHLLFSDRPSPSKADADRLYSTSAPKVLIYHSHATEGYAETAGTGFRTSDDELNTVAIGAIITEVLEKAGIPTVHLQTRFDEKDWSAAYDNSNAAVTSVLRDNPSIQYIFDVHRDCIGNSDEGYVRAATTVYGKDTAQLMFVCGTDEGGSGHTGWRSNLTFALQLQSEIFGSHPSLMRPVNLRRASFYQSTSPSSLILECGTCAGTLREAKRSAVIFAKELCDYIYGYDCGLDTEALINSLCP